MRTPITLSLAVVAAAAAAVLAALPAAAGGAAHAEPVDPGMIAVADYGNNSVKVFHPNGTLAFVLGPSFGDNMWLIQPQDVDIASDGQIYVADHVNGNVRVFHPNGTFAFTIGSRGYVQGQFMFGPTGVAVGPDGRVAVIDDHHGRVQVFYPNGTFALDMGLGVGAPGPTGVAVGPDGRVYVAINYVDRGVRVFHPNGTFAFALGPNSVDDGRFNLSLGDVAVGADGRVYVATNHGIVHVFHPNGTSAFVFGGYWPCYRVGGVAVGADGRVVVTCAQLTDGRSPSEVDQHIWVYRPDGTFAFAFGSTGSIEPGYASSPIGVAVGPDGRVYAATDHHQSDIRVFHPNGTFAFALDRNGVYDGEHGEPHGRFFGLSDVDVGPDGRVYAASRDGVRVFHPNGTFAFGLGAGIVVGYAYDYPSDVDVGPDGRIYVADRYADSSSRVRVFHPNGTFAFTLGDGFVSGGWHFYAAITHMDVGPDGLIYVSTPSDGVLAFHLNGTNIPITWARHTSHFGSVGPDGRVYVGARDGGVKVFHPNGTLDFSLSPLGASSGAGASPLAVGPDGRVYVGARDGGVKVFHPNGTFAFAMGEPRKKPGVITSPILGVAIGPGLPPSLPPAPPAPPAPLFTGDGAGAPVTVVIEPGAGAAGPLDFTGAGHAANLTIDVTGLMGPGGPPLDGSAASTVTFPPAETSVAASFATVTFPPSVEATHVPADGRLALRVTADVPDDARVQDALAYDGSGRVALQRVVEVGDESGRVAFDMPVRILLEGQAGGRAFYIEGGADGGPITPIDQACADDDVARVHRHLDGAGECQIDSADDDKIIYTYHLTRFGTVLPERSAPPPAVHTCSVAIGMPGLVTSVRPGGYSAPVRQEVINSGSAPFASVELAATPWLDGPDAGPSPSSQTPAPPAPVLGTTTGRASTVLTASLVWSLPASVTEVSSAGAGGPYGALANGATVAGGLGGGDSSPLWFRLNLAPYADAQGGGTLVQEVTYQAMCRVP